MQQAQFATLFTVVLFFGVLVAVEVGRRVGLRRVAGDAKSARAGAGAIDGVVFALLGLLIAFTFNGAASRFDARRSLVVEEVNDIGTAWLRLDLVPADRQAALREKFRQYVDSRMQVFRLVPDLEAVQRELARSQELQAEIWKESVAALQVEKNPAATSLLLSALNAMFDITTTRTMAARTHPPMVVFGMLGVMAILAALLVGVGMTTRHANWFHSLAFAIVMAGTVYVILDMEYPRVGLIRVTGFDQAMEELRATMSEGG